MPNWEIEDKFSGLICGVDEAGRGPWVGPVAAGAVMCTYPILRERKGSYQLRKPVTA